MIGLGQIVIVLSVAVIAVPLFKRAGLGAVLGYIAAGMVLGPYGLGVFKAPDNVMHMSEFGVVLLMFVIGIELQFSRLKALRKPIFGLGSLQVVLCVAALGGAMVLAGGSYTAAIVVGCALALSSTAFVLQLLAEKKELTSAHGRLSFAFLLFQDISVIPIMAFLPFLAGGGETNAGWQDLLTDAVQIVVLFAAIVIVARYLLRGALKFVHSTGVREISIAATLLVVSGTALLMEFVGLSMALGAFVAGVLLAESEFRHQLEADIEPFKGLLLGLFFISVGMTLNLSKVISSPLQLLSVALLLMLIKTVVIAAVGYWGGKIKGVNALKLGLLLSQGGEFGFVILSLAGQLDLVDRVLREQMTAVITLSMILTPLLLTLFEKLTPHLVRETEPAFEQPDEVQSGVVIAGFGRYGQISGRLLASLQIPFTALDISPDQVDVVRKFGNKVHYGDASQLDVLHAAKTGDAKVLVLAIDDISASLRTARLMQQNFPHVRILARARNRRHAHCLMDAGVTWILRETYLSALATAEELLVTLGRERAEAQELTTLFREADQRTLRRQYGMHHDPEKIIESSKESAEALRGLFEQDLAGTDHPPR
ncbi:monovalent cation:proton antiporter-2 (CPA2) family protein [Marinobacter sp. X15-166B]|uniref:monovalent cation:proton antiporter-2 (CPA2) family protein n=1 Tax=Marinobacter sp. X15-166B TaxID=1897620 RepID=UPI00085BDF38|nr:monovalent cation:proton antiporter-2 (CPA2) family protein [Marinobacter sp. X15-166B]OEY65470.1 glutathione-regulated potassium-efflux system protein KefB [Marinobacter sp. X15-166B]